MLVTPDTDFSNISWNWICYQRAFGAIYQNYFWKLTLFADAILLQIWLYSRMPSLVWFVWKTNEILHIVQSDGLGVCFSIGVVVYLLISIFTIQKTITPIDDVCILFFNIQYSVSFFFDILLLFQFLVFKSCYSRVPSWSFY